MDDPTEIRILMKNNKTKKDILKDMLSILIKLCIVRFEEHSGKIYKTKIYPGFNNNECTQRDNMLIMKLATCIFMCLQHACVQV